MSEKASKRSESNKKYYAKKKAEKLYNEYYKGQIAEQNELFNEARLKRIREEENQYFFNNPDGSGTTTVLDPTAYIKKPSPTKYAIAKAAQEYVELQNPNVKSAFNSQDPISVDEVNGMFPEYGGKVDVCFEDPYLDSDKRLLHDNYRRHPTIRLAINVLTNFMFGKRLKTALDTNKEYVKEEDKKKDYDKILNNKYYQTVQQEVDNINRKVKFTEKCEAATQQAFNFGKAALLVELGDDGLPIALKVLSSTSIGRLFHDTRTWKLVAIEYKDFKREQQIIPAERLIWFPWQNNHMTAGSYDHGLSMVEPVMHLAESDRVAMEQDIKEIVRSLWAAYLIVKINRGADYNPRIAKAFMDDFMAGRPLATLADITVTPITVQHDLDKLVQLLIENSKKILATCEVSQLMGGYEDVANRASAISVLHAWKNSVLLKKRTWLRGIVEEQWIDRIVKTIVQNGITDKGIDPENEGVYNLAVEPDLELAKIDDVADYEFKIKITFEDFVLTSFIETATAIVQLLQNKVIDLRKALEILDWEDVIDRRQIPSLTLQQEDEQAQQKALDQMQMMKDQQQPDPSKDSPPNSKDPGDQPPGPSSPPNKLNPKNRLTGSRFVKTNPTKQ